MVSCVLVYVHACVCVGVYVCTWMCVCYKMVYQSTDPVLNLKERRLSHSDLLISLVHGFQIYYHSFKSFS